MERLEKAKEVVREERGEKKTSEIVERRGVLMVL